MKLDQEVYRRAAYQQHFTNIGAYFAILNATNDEWPNAHYEAYKSIFGKDYYKRERFESMLALLFMAEIVESENEKTG